MSFKKIKMAISTARLTGVEPKHLVHFVSLGRGLSGRGLNWRRSMNAPRNYLGVRH